MNTKKISFIHALKDISKDIRKDIIRMIANAGSGHTGGSLGLADIFTVLYFNILNHDPENPGWEERDRLILSIGHVAPVQYAALAYAGYFPKEELLTLRSWEADYRGIRDEITDYQAWSFRQDRLDKDYQWQLVWQSLQRRIIKITEFTALMGTENCRKVQYGKPQ